MKAYVVETRKKIEPFGDLARNCLILNRPLAELQRDALERSGLEVIFVSSKVEISDCDEHLITNDNVFFTPELIALFLKLAREGGRVAVCALTNGTTTQRTGAGIQDVPYGNSFTQYNLCYIPKDGHDNLSRVVTIDPDEFSFSVKVPRHMCGSKGYQIPMSDKLIVQIDHWANLWAANIVAILADGARLERKTWSKKLWFAVKAWSFNKWKILWHLNKSGRGCDIHPTAYIEGSTIGENVTIGAKAVVRESVIGNNVTIGNSTVVEESVIGENCAILKGHILYSVFYPGVFSFAEMVSASILGQDVFIGSDVTLTDFRIDGKNVTVIKNSKPVDSGNLFLGSCVGHRTRLGSGTIVVPGRMIPCDLQIVARRERIVSGKFDDLVVEGPFIRR